MPIRRWRAPMVTALILVLAGWTSGDAGARRAPTSSERAAIAKALHVPSRCAIVHISTIDRHYASYQSSRQASCAKYAGDGIDILHRGTKVWHDKGGMSDCTIATVAGVPVKIYRELTDHYCGVTRAARAAPAVARFYIPCAPQGSNGVSNLVLKYRPSTCLTLDRRASFAGASDLRGIHWHNWEKTTATATASLHDFHIGAPVLQAKIKVDQIHFCGHPFYARMRVTTKYGTGTQWLAPGCEYVSRQDEFARAVEADVDVASGTKVTHRDCWLSGNAWKWRCSATAEWAQHDDLDPRGFVYCTAEFRGHFTSDTDRAMVDNDPGCDPDG